MQDYKSFLQLPPLPAPLRETGIMVKFLNLPISHPAFLGKIITTQVDLHQNPSLQVSRIITPSSSLESWQESYHILLCLGEVLPNCIAHSMG